MKAHFYFADSSIAYLYDADGNKLRASYAVASYAESMPVTQVMQGSISSQVQQPYMTRNSIDYCGSAVYENGKLAYVPIDGGYITFADSTAASAPTFHYYVKDYLGNIRLVVRDDGYGEQMNHYYPFGALTMASSQGEAQRYKYNAKELDRIHGLNLYDYGARQYDAALGRWTSVDPLAEKYYDVSPYAYCLGNPIRFVDVLGNEPGDPFRTPDEAALDFARIYNYWSIRANREYNSLIYYYKDEQGNTIYSYNKPSVGAESSSFPNKFIPANAKVYADAHTHAAYDGDTEEPHIGNDFSPEDIETYKSWNFKASYLATTNGTFKKLIRNSSQKVLKVTFKGNKFKLPSDERDPTNNGYTVQKIDRERNEHNMLYKVIHNINKQLEKGYYGRKYKD